MDTSLAFVIPSEMVLSSSFLHCIDSRSQNIYYICAILLAVILAVPRVTSMMLFLGAFRERGIIENNKQINNTSFNNTGRTNPIPLSGRHQQHERVDENHILPKALSLLSSPSKALIYKGGQQTTSPRFLRSFDASKDAGNCRKKIEMKQRRQDSLLSVFSGSPIPSAAAARAHPSSHTRSRSRWALFVGCIRKPRVFAPVLLCHPTCRTPEPYPGPEYWCLRSIKRASNGGRVPLGGRWLEKRLSNALRTRLLTLHPRGFVAFWEVKMILCRARSLEEAASGYRAHRRLNKRAGQ